MTKTGAAQVEVEPVGKYEWLDLILQLRIPPQRKAVAQAVAWFAKRDGSKVHPGQQKVADMANLHVSKAGPHIRALEGAGLLKLVKAGGGRAGAPHHYRLSRPVDISGLPLWLDPEMDRYPAGGLLEEIHRPPTVGVADPAMRSPTREQEPPEVDETEEHRPPAVGIPAPAGPVDNSEYRPPTADVPPVSSTADGLNSPVDNSEHRPFRSETPTASHGNTDRPRLRNTLRTPSEHLLGLPQATNQLGDTVRSEPQNPIEIAADANGHRLLAAAFLDGEETTVLDETPAGRVRTQAEYAAARKVLDRLDDREHWLNAAHNELAARGRTAPPTAFVVSVAAELHRRAAHIAPQSPNGA